MPTVKTAVAVPQDVHDQAERVARDLKISRSVFFTLAVEEFLRRREAQALREGCDRAHARSQTAEELEGLKLAEELHWETLEPETWWSSKEMYSGLSASGSEQTDRLYRVCECRYGMEP